MRGDCVRLTNDFIRMLGTINKFFDFAGKQRYQIVKGLALDFARSSVQGANMFAITYVIKAITTGTVNMRTAYVSFSLVAAAAFMSILFDYISHTTKFGAMFMMVSDSMISNGERLKYIPLGFFNENNLGEITQTMTNSMADVEEIAPMVIINVIQGFMQTIVYIFILFIIDYRIPFIMFAAIGLFFVNQFFLQRKTRVISPKRESSYTKFNSAALEFIQGMATVREYSLDETSHDKINSAIKGCERQNLELEFAIIPFAFLQGYFLKLFTLLICASACYFHSRGSLDSITTIILLILSFLIFEKMNKAGLLSTMFRIVDGAFDRIQKIADTPLMDIDGKDTKIESYDIVGEHVTFAYEHRKVIDDISFAIKNHSMTAIVGPSGSGKTTLCNLIARFWDANSGSISIGNQNIKELKLDNLLSKISMVFQSVYLFNDTIANNIRFGKPDATMEEVIDAATRACCDDFIKKLPNGYDTIVGESGSTLSGGEKQRISIARALLKNASIIILDEATANIDPENEDRLQKAIEELIKDKTVIMIAHRLKTIRNADQILVLDHGKIVQRGNHEQLMKEGGIYSDLINVRKEAISWKI